MSLVRLFVDHPATVGETYSEHLRHASGFGFAMISGGLACLVHAVLPFAFVTRGSETIARLYDRMITNRSKHSAQAATAHLKPPLSPSTALNQPDATTR